MAIQNFCRRVHSVVVTQAPVGSAYFQVYLNSRIIGAFDDAHIENEPILFFLTFDPILFIVQT